MRSLVVQIKCSGIAAGASVPCIARLGADDGPFDEQVVWPANHQQMLDIIPADNDELAMTVEIVGVDDAKPGLARPGPSAQA